ncbi:DeoR family transcriptional regulator [Halopolyspora algeriensis]|uniref:DeoR family transcriptional regulator n=1 Tax=Halopolyspora algeriensis TaxID=1500506 RepID=A0A368VH53_9ACTN|nr:DeoR/GlpR family DNA-binding transcription regulator [Halopolyspora algeriensis]RCW40509.1 DeoR family transcriptional regulator [Halopolyspora algeriensis]TQM53792.1 DeoR family transcriptional regulator [Halopolyspora algeriensis]
MMRDRQAEILRSVEDGVRRVEDLAAALRISPSTVRRDLTDLERAGRVVRTHGGAVPAGGEQSWQQKSRRHAPAKRAIAARAADLVTDGDTVLLGAGSTSTLIAENLVDRSGVSVYTNGIGALLALREAEGIEVCVLGGSVRRRTGAIIGAAARHALQRISVDLAFLGADGFVPGRGINTLTEELAELKEVKLRSARHSVVTADSSKIGCEPHRFWAPVSGPYTVITDDGLSDTAAAALRGDGDCTLIVVPDPVAGRTEGEA